MNTLRQKHGALPTWGWLAISVGVVVAIIIIRRRAASAAQSPNIPAVPAGNALPPNVGSGYAGPLPSIGGSAPTSPMSSPVQMPAPVSPVQTAAQTAVPAASAATMPASPAATTPVVTQPPPSPAPVQSPSPIAATSNLASFQSQYTPQEWTWVQSMASRYPTIANWTMGGSSGYNFPQGILPNPLGFKDPTNPTAGYTSF